MIIPYPVVYAPATENSYTLLLDLPPRVSCPRYPTLNFTDSLAQQWNCQKCKIQPYFSLFQVGDIIPIQLNLPDRRNNLLGSITRPNVGWQQLDLINPFWYIKAELYDGSTTSPTLILSRADLFCSDWWVGYSELVGSVQTLFVDTSLFPIGTTTFRIKITTIDSTFSNDIVLWSEPFCVARDCKNSVVVSGNYRTVDCENRDYRTPDLLNFIHTPFNGSNPIDYIPTPFYTSWRYQGIVTPLSFGAEKTLNDLDKVIRQKSIDTYRLTLSEILPPYAAKILAATLRGSEFYIDNVQYDTASDVSKNIDEGLGFLPSIDLTRTCQINNNKCN